MKGQLVVNPDAQVFIDSDSFDTEYLLSGNIKIKITSTSRKQHNIGFICI